MPHDGQTIPDGTVILPDLLALAGAAVAPAETLLAAATERLRADLSVDGRITGALLEANQTAAHGLAWLATYVESLRQMHAWAERLNGAGKFGEVEQLILQIGMGEYLWQIYGGIPMSQGEILRRRTSA
jgi:(2S)-methylsuccinyl-CoA dehydrogenase